MRSLPVIINTVLKSGFRIVGQGTLPDPATVPYGVGWIDESGVVWVDVGGEWVLMPSTLTDDLFVSYFDDSGSPVIYDIDVDISVDDDGDIFVDNDGDILF